MSEELTALIALHGEQLPLLSLTENLESRGYTRIDLAETQEELLRMCQERRYTAVIMDVNFQYPNSTDFSASQQVYPVIEDSVKEGKTRFYPIAASERVVKEARRQGIQCARTKSDFYRNFTEEFGEPPQID